MNRWLWLLLFLACVIGAVMWTRSKPPTAKDDVETPSPTIGNTHPQGAPSPMPSAEEPPVSGGPLDGNLTPQQNGLPSARPPSNVANPANPSGLPGQPENFYPPPPPPPDPSGFQQIPPPPPSFPNYDSPDNNIPPPPSFDQNSVDEPAFDGGYQPPPPPPPPDGGGQEDIVQ
jgi:hypothetical protein